ncbi:metallophosphoesterase [Kitasatospora sp. NRRL B-11411]|uniref:metallophosphoesterase n=1 Tax=Kitasatospora sp. NRRL B-11411 TaxID=1463822 RepID=UPI00069002E5|nr:metallophosphoesterase [Kitasatospora sp. NRRL B-11411]
MALAVVVSGVGVARAVSAGGGATSDQVPAGAGLFVSEVHPDDGTPANVPDDFEFFEVTNTTGEAVDLAARQIGVGYSTDAAPTDASFGSALKFAVSDGVAGNAVTPGPLAAVVPAHGSTVFWLDHSDGGVNTYARSEADFRAFYGNVPDDVAIVRVEGQAGIANGGQRALGLVDASVPSALKVPSWSFVPARVPATPGASTHFTVPAGGARAALFSNGPATPGTVAPSQLVPGTDGNPEPTPAPSPGTTPTAGPSAGPGPTPTPSPSPSASGVPPVDPALRAPLLQVTELAPDTANVNGSDGYEFVEVYNASQSPVRWNDFTLEYLYLDASRVVTSSALWPSVPADTVIGPGRTLVLWVRNGADQALTAADFNKHWGSNLTPGVDLVETFNGGMANGGPRGIRVSTDTGYEISRADYLNDDQTVADEPIQYRWESGTAQTMIGPGPATPGRTDPGQVPAGLVADPASDTAPVVTDLRGTGEAPVTDDLELTFAVTDDHQVRTVELTLDTDTTEPSTRRLRAGAPGRYSCTVPKVDLFGKGWIEYRVVARDGAHSTVLDTVRIDLRGGGAPEPVRLNVTDGQYVGGQVRLAGTTAGKPDGPGLRVDGEPVAPGVPALEQGAYFAFEATNTDAFFRNGVKLDDQVLNVFDEGYYERVVTVPTRVPVERIRKGEPLTLSIWAGTKGYPELSTADDNDDFSVRNLRLALPDGRVLRPVVVGVNATNGATAYDPPVRTVLSAGEDTLIAMGDGAADYDYLEATFTLPDDAFTSLAHVWDTTAVPDGPHTVSATADGRTVTRTVQVDNTRPQLTPTVEPGRRYRGGFTVDATAGDAGSGVKAVSATLDGKPVALPYAASSLTLAPGAHTAVFTAVDAIGNTATSRVDFSTDGVEPAVSSRTALPYQLFTVPVPEGAGADAQVRLSWAGSANTGAKVLLYALNSATGKWEEVDRRLTTGAEGGRASFTLGGTVPVADHVKDGQVTVLVQHSEGFPGGDRSARDSAVTPYSAGATPRDAYDFTIGWQSDTQYYNENQGWAAGSGGPDTWYAHQLAINDFFLSQRDDLNLQYVIHTGDIVDDYRATDFRGDNHDPAYEWKNADAAYKPLNEAGLPYGVLAGNHDVGHAADDYSQFGTYFGADRYRDNPWYGGETGNNRGHYDLVSAGGVDFLMLSMGWDPGDEQIAWMNSVIRQYPERKVWIDLHEYLLTTGTLGPVPQRIHDEVVKPNSNVFAVSSGHYHDAYTRTDGFDDDGDGVADRTVHSMLFDYQGLEQGGLGFLRLLHFDNTGQKIVVRTYSPSLDTFDSPEPSLNDPAGQQEFEIPYAAVGLRPQDKVLGTDSFRAAVLTGKDIAVVKGVPSGARADVVWRGVQPGAHGWYVETTGPHGGMNASAVRTFTATGATLELDRNNLSGKNISVRVTISSPGYTTVVRTAAPAEKVRHG